MIKVTPSIINRWKEVSNADSILKTKRVKMPKPVAYIDTHVENCKSTFFDLIEQYNYPKSYKNRQIIFIDWLKSLEPGGGTIAVKKAVKESIDMGFEGRVALSACNIDPTKGHPFVFYYKLGFRSTKIFHNLTCKLLLKLFGNNPPIGMFTTETPLMYLPKRNIQKCLEYPEKKAQLFYKPREKGWFDRF